MEREIKLQANKEQLKQILSLPVLVPLLAGPPRTERLISTYFDTRDLIFHEEGIALRVRAVGDSFVQTLKTEGSTEAGMYVREEYETPVEANVPDIGALRDCMPKKSSVAKLLAMTDVATALAPQFTTRVKRTVLSLQFPEGDEVEVALDDGVIEGGSLTEVFQEVELELKTGKPDRLYHLALDLLRVVPMRISSLSKGERGYNLIRPMSYSATRAEPLTLRKKDTVEAAFECIVQNCLTQIQGNELGVIKSDDAEPVHQMRVGIRRLRSAIDLVEPLLVFPVSLEAELKWIAGKLGAARDWEVLATSTLSGTFGDAHRDFDAQAMLRVAGETARQHRTEAAASVDSTRYACLVIELTRWFEQSQWREGLDDERRDALSMPVSEFAAEALHERHRKLMKRGRHLPDLDPDTRHRARIAAKKLRYAMEFFATLYEKKTLQNYAATLTQLQDDLGWRNDLAVADGLLRDLAVTAPDAAVGAAYARGFLASRMAEDYGKLKTLWSEFKRLSEPK
ncbi:CHAD domain protein (plasmid) [Caballeronia sp. SBC1]|uniref:CYTH and CHAD domain-containing protein n=1 Tax=unclassified Caballeronia TaxID=2646786 RepID=UPI0013E1821D|nr:MULTISPECIES: CYTH and CHAD domain-containing protein [unclassified Caballeronia]QIE29330.1 CHAD domain protein [Caballeronia sp. SBC2]QIN67236.1 CHAD domain protein [Caballeronia sp. SBC1]